MLLQLFFVYIIVIGSIFSLYLTTQERTKKQLAFTQSELAGVAYLKAIYKLSVSLALYKEGLEVDMAAETQLSLKEEMKKDIDALYLLLKKFPQFKNDILNKKLIRLSNNEFTDEEYYAFLDYINHENYKIGDISRLLFEEDRMSYFLGTLITHYMPEYLISLLIVHNKAEEFKYKGFLDKDQKRLYTEQNKLIYLSAQELEEIITLLKPYPQAHKLHPLILKIQEKLKILDEHSGSFKNWVKNEEELDIYHHTTYLIFALSSELNDEYVALLESHLKQREEKLEKKVFYNNISLVLITLLLSLLSYFFYRSNRSNLSKDEEIKRINETLDKHVFYSRTDPQGHITHVSTALLELTGYTKKEMIGRTHRLFKHPDMKEEVFVDLWKTLLSKQTWTGEIKNKRKDSTSYWVKMVISPDLDKDGNIIGFDAYRENITSRKALEAEQKKSQEALEFKSMFLSNMSHEIRTPLNGIIGFTHLALETNLDNKQRELIEKVQSASELLLGVINDILDISKIESGKMTVENIPFNLEEKIKIVQDLLQNKADEQGIMLTVDYGDITHFNRKGDPLKFSQILTNLLSNAIKFTEKGGVILELKDLGQDKIRFNVIDTGIGLKEEQRKSLFKEFTQADMSTTRKYGGTGLGLAICKKLVELMHGKIEVKSTFCVGSTFSFELVLEEISSLEVSKSQEKQDLESLKEEINALEGIHILAAEDNKMNQIFLEMLLEETPIHLDFADDGEIALKMVQNRDYDLIFMDIQMPNMNGYQATQAIKAIYPDLPIIALSANVMQEDIQKSFDAGLDDHLGKPVEIQELYALLLKYLNP